MIHLEPTEQLIQPKRFWVLGWDQYYPDGGLRNVIFYTNEIDSARVHFDELVERHDYVQIVDIFDDNRVLSKKDRSW